MGIEDQLFTHNGKKREEDVLFIRNMNCEIMEERIFIRATARKVNFSHVKFNQCIFDNCYFRNCVFDSCEFIGCKFLSTNFNGSNFVGCDFMYSIFERSLIEIDSLKCSLPSEENLRAKLLRSLRVNYQQQGDVNSANQVINLELKASKEHLFKSWFSNEVYYRNKYKELDRAKKFIEWLSFIFFDFVWGNGESVYKLCRTVIIIFLIISLHDAIPIQDKKPSEVIELILNSPAIFFGIHPALGFSELNQTIIYFIRLVVFGLFMSILIKRISRR